MTFSIERFLNVNRRPISWMALVGLLYVVRDLFSLIFLTFLIVIIAQPIVDYFHRRTRFPRFAILSAVFLTLTAGFVSAICYAIPNITQEATAFANELPRYQESLLNYWRDSLSKYKQLAPFEPMINSQVRELLDQGQASIGPILLGSARLAVTSVATTGAAITFAFLVLIDLKGLTAELQRLQHSRLREFYEETAEPVVQFFVVLAKSFQAQAQVAIFNTAIVAIGFSVLGLPKLTLLLLIVFVFSFVPVVGVIISTTPAVLIAVNAKGWDAGFAVLSLILVINTLEAYVLNPVIYGNHLKLNPVLTLLILYVGHHFFGVWGAILGVPVATYFLYYVFAVPRMDSTPADPQTKDSQHHKVQNS